MRANMEIFAETVEFLSPAELKAQAAPQTAQKAANDDLKFIEVEDEQLPF